jgi:glutathione S-transferase
VLVDGDLTVCDSAAILEYVNESYAGGKLLPADAGKRAAARSVCAEMHAGFSHLRQNFPMNLARPVTMLPPDEETAAEIRRILSLWEGLLEAHEEEGPYLFGAWGLADCMYLPVATRFFHYGVDLSGHPRSAAYVEQLYALPSFQEWREAALSETETIPGQEWP